MWVFPPERYSGVCVYWLGGQWCPEVICLALLTVIFQIAALLVVFLARPVWAPTSSPFGSRILPFVAKDCSFLLQAGLSLCFLEISQ